MKRTATLAVILALLGAWSASLPAQTATPVTRTFAAPLDRVWVVTESVLTSLGWDIDKQDRAVGWISNEGRSGP